MVNPDAKTCYSTRFYFLAYFTFSFFRILAFGVNEASVYLWMYEIESLSYHKNLFYTTMALDAHFPLQAALKLMLPRWFILTTLVKCCENNFEHNTHGSLDVTKFNQFSSRKHKGHRESIKFCVIFQLQDH